MTAPTAGAERRMPKPSGPTLQDVAGEHRQEGPSPRRAARRTGRARWRRARSCWSRHRPAPRASRRAASRAGPPAWCCALIRAQRQDDAERIEAAGGEEGDRGRDGDQQARRGGPKIAAPCQARARPGHGARQLAAGAPASAPWRWRMGLGRRGGRRTRRPRRRSGRATGSDAGPGRPGPARR